MAHALAARTPRHQIAIPIVAIAALALAWGRSPADAVLAGLGIILALAVLAAVHHAEIIALRVGEPFGSLVLAVAVTVIEVGLIVVLMTQSPDTTLGLARDTVFSAAMIACNGIVGAAIVVATIRGRITAFNAEGAGAAIAAIGTLGALTLVLPTFTISSPGPTFTTTQLVFASVAALAIYAVFVLVQTVRHRDFFLPEEETATHDTHVDAPSGRRTALSLALLAVSLAAVVGLAKATSPLIERGVEEAGLPTFVVAVAIALLVLLPESISAIRAARRGRTQTSLNLAYGSAMASIGLTIPAVAVISLLFGIDVQLGLSNVEIVLLLLTLFVSTLTVAPGRATLLQGAVHLAIFGGFLVVAMNP